MAGLSENTQKNTKNAKNAISPNSFGRKLKNGLSYIGTFRIQELANGDLGMIKKIKNRGERGDPNKWDVLKEVFGVFGKVSLSQTAGK